MRPFTIILILCFIGFLQSKSYSQDINHYNLEGTWTMDTLLAKRLGLPNSDFIQSLKFTHDASDLPELKEIYKEDFKDIVIH